MAQKPTTFDTETPTPCTYPGCDRILKGNAGLGGHLAWHNRQDRADDEPILRHNRKTGNQEVVGYKPKRKGRPRKQTPELITPVETMSAVTICFTVLSAMFPAGSLPVSKLPIVQRWAQETERFVEEMYGDH